MAEFPIESILYSQFIKYDRLGELIHNQFKGSTATEVNLYIDLQQMWSSVMSGYSIKDMAAVAAITLNQCAHYRGFFKKIGVNTKCILVWSSNLNFDAINICPEYNYKYLRAYNVNKAFNELTEFNRSILRLLCPYLNDIYFVESEVEPTIMVNELMQNVFTTGENIFVSKSLYAFQLPAYTNAITLVKHKVTSPAIMDASICVNKDNCISSYIFEVRKKDTNGQPLSPLFMSTVMAMVGIPTRSIKRLISYDRVYKILENLDSVMYPDLVMMYSVMHNYMTKKEAEALPFEVFESRVKAIDLGYQTRLYKAKPQSMYRSYLTRLNDPDKVKAINNNYFIDNPIDLQRL